MAGAVTWESVSLVTMNHADREDLVDQMIDAQTRAHPVDLPAVKVHTTPTPMDLLEGKAVAEFARCGGRRPDPHLPEADAPIWALDELIARASERKRKEQRSEMAEVNSVFTLRRIAICRSFGGCGPDLPMSIERPSRATLDWEAETDRETLVPSTWSNAEPFVLSLACGMGLREKQGLPSYPNEARFVVAERQFRADHARSCAQGKRLGCQ